MYTDAERGVLPENRRIIAGLIERIPELEAPAAPPSTAQERPQEAAEPAGRGCGEGGAGRGPWRGAQAVLVAQVLRVRVGGAVLAESTKSLVDEANDIVEECLDIVDETIQFVHAIPKEHEKAQGEYFAAHEEAERARKVYRRLDYSEKAPKHKLAVAFEKMREAEREAERLYRYYRSERLDVEYQEIVARQIASLLHDQAYRRLGDIVARSADPEVRRAVSDLKDDVARATYYVSECFPERKSEVGLSGPDLSDVMRVRRARLEAATILEGRTGLPVKP